MRIYMFFCFVFLAFDPLNSDGGGHLLKPGGRMHGHINPPPFSNHSHPLTPFFSNCSHLMTPFSSDNSQPIFDNLSPNDSFFFKILVKNVSKCVFCLENWPQLSNSLLLTPPFLFSHWMTPFFGEKSITDRPLVLSCCPYTPITSNVESPPLDPKQVQETCYIIIYHYQFYRITLHCLEPQLNRSQHKTNGTWQQSSSYYCITFTGQFFSLFYNCMMSQQQNRGAQI